MRLILPLLILVFSSGLTATQKPLNPLVYLSEQYAPFNYLDEYGLQTGYAIELLHQIWYEMGLTPQPIQILPWARAYSTTRHKNNTLLFSASRINSREKLFKWACSIIDLRIVLLGLVSKNLKIASLEEAKKYDIVAINKDVGEQLLLESNFDLKKVQQVSLLEHGLKMVLMGRVDLLSSTELNAYQKLSEMNLDPDLFEVVWVLNSYPVCFAFNLNVEEEVVTNFQQALLKVQENKAYIKMLKRKYGLNLK